MAGKNATPIAKASNVNKGRRITGSMADQIDNLGVGHSISVAERLPTVKTGGDAINESLKRMRSTMGAYVSRVVDGDLDTREFKTESGVYLTDDKSGIVASVVVTRLS